MQKTRNCRTSWPGSFFEERKNAGGISFGGNVGISRKKLEKVEISV
ncbi:MAG: hypothetical protein IKI23_03625 [Lachnospiraceae bacterium]|jgi:hypothetical protein|nr:hypothetical protein [Lachnospiraceae bacterium]